MELKSESKIVEGLSLRALKVFRLMKIAQVEGFELMELAKEVTLRCWNACGLLRFVTLMMDAFNLLGVRNGKFE